MSLTMEESYDWCQSLTKRTAGNFYFSFLTLPAEKLRDMCVLYAFMRVSDDIGDEPGHTTAKRRIVLEEWRKGLAATLVGDLYDHPVFPGLKVLVEKYDIPHEHLFAVLDGIAMDLEPIRFQTFDQLQHYCYHVAGVVGLCCLHVWGFSDPKALELGIDCGLAFQLTNILRDVGEDAQWNRLYLPEGDLQQFDYNWTDLQNGVYDDRFIALMEFEAARAEEYYERAKLLLQYVDQSGKAILAAMVKIYGGLLQQIKRRKFDVLHSRVELPRWKKLQIACSAMIRHRWLGR